MNTHRNTYIQKAWKDPEVQYLESCVLQVYFFLCNIYFQIPLQLI